MDSEPTRTNEDVSSQNLVVEILDRQFPFWSLGDVAMVAGFFLLAYLFFGILALLIASGLPAFKAKNAIQIWGDVRIALAIQAVAYLAAGWFVYRMIARHYGVPFLRGIHWKWPKTKWPVYLIGGVVLAYLITSLEAILPKPPELPIDKFFRSPIALWLFASFGTVLAPLVEELFFRGLLFPALLRKLSVPVTILLTAFLFTLLHGVQLGWSWGPLLLIFLVALALTVVRARAQSVAASVLVHLGYNLTLFFFEFIGTDGFRNLDKVIH